MERIFRRLTLLILLGGSMAYGAPHIAYTDTGKGQALVLIHAFPTDKSLWVPQQSLASHFRVITLDLWGFGQSQSVSGEAVSMADYADEVALLLRRLRIKKAILAGESMGGYVALAFMKNTHLKRPVWFYRIRRRLRIHPPCRKKGSRQRRTSCNMGARPLSTDFCLRLCQCMRRTPYGSGLTIYYPRSHLRQWPRR